MAAFEQIGIDVSMRENVSQAAGSAGRSVDELRERIAALNREMSPDKASEFFNAMNQQAAERNQRRESERFTQGGIAAPATAFGREVRTAGGAFNRMGQGDATAGVEEVSGLLGRVLGSGALGAAGGVATALAAVGTAKFVGTELAARPYENVMGTGMDLAMQLGEYGDGVQDQSRKFIESLDRASESAARFGYRMQDAAGIMTDLAQSGARGDIDGLTQQALRFGRGFGIDPDALSGFAGRASRFGDQNALGRVAGTLAYTGMGPARFQEVMGVQSRVFEEALSKGVIRGFDEIAQMQAMVGQAGEVYQGAEGERIIRSMDAAVRSAPGLNRDMDALLLEAGRNVYGKDLPYHELAMMMEQGMNPELFGEVQRLTGVYGGGSTMGQINYLRQLFGEDQLSVTDAYRMMGMDPEAGSAFVDQLSAPPEEIMSTYEVRSLQAQEDIRAAVNRMSFTFQDDKARQTEMVAGVVNGLQERLFNTEDEIERRTQLDNSVADNEYGENVIAPAVSRAASYLRNGSSRGTLETILGEMPEYSAGHVIRQLETIDRDFGMHLRNSGAFDEYLSGANADTMATGFREWLDAQRTSFQNNRPVGDIRDFIRNLSESDVAGLTDDIRRDLMGSLADSASMWDQLNNVPRGSATQSVQDYLREVESYEELERTLRGNDAKGAFGIDLTGEERRTLRTEERELTNLLENLFRELLRKNDDLISAVREPTFIEKDPLDRFRSGGAYGIT